VTALALALALAVLPQGAARYRVEIAGEPVGAAELEVRCARDRCAVRWDTRLRLPDASGGPLSVRTVELDVDRDGRAVAGAVRHFRDGERWTVEARAGLVPAALAEVALVGRGEGCLEVFEEETLEVGRACLLSGGDVRTLEVLGVRERVRPGRRGFPAAVEIPEQGARFVADARARAPARPPRLYGTRVPGPRDPARASSFCGAGRDAPAAAPPAAAPPPAAAGASCREKTEAYLARAAASGLRGRTAVGVAWDGAAFVWHAWAELERPDGAWAPVDPSFGESPARGPRFTLARYADADRAGRLEAGRRILACWGRAGVAAR
jgi:hypothetical protein